MHPTLQNAIDNPRFARPYGSDPRDIAYNNHESGSMAVDRFVKRMFASVRRRPGSSGDYEYH
jgi:hypothetical protein